MSELNGLLNMIYWPLIIGPLSLASETFNNFIFYPTPHYII